MLQTRSTVLADTRGRPDLAKEVSSILHGATPPMEKTTALPFSADARWDRIAATVLLLLFDLTQQAARFGSGIAPWGQLAVYDVDDFAPFTAGGSI
ncbi:hypothetical protein [Streptomyces sp. GbtcB6]|uniref:hypothetical protein n=1 Tax=Streptomyces sp. GbtcB6 TaxID=2824751 RepID=UPI001C3053EE|nr:hypothetical protein [Streptomyces sp. GbtcB6]